MSDRSEERSAGEVDERMLEALVEMIGPELRPIWGKYLMQTREGLQQLSARAPMATIPKLAHKLKGASASLGLTSLAAGFARLEADAANGRAPAPSELEWLARQLDEAEAILEKHLPDA